MSRPGTDEDFGAMGNDFTDLVLDDHAADPIDGIADINPPGGYFGSYKPDEPLSAFDGQERLGTWTLNVFDNYAPEDSGTLHGWGLVPVGRSCSGPANAAPVAGATRTPSTPAQRSARRACWPTTATPTARSAR